METEKVNDEEEEEKRETPTANMMCNQKTICFAEWRWLLLLLLVVVVGTFSTKTLFIGMTFEIPVVKYFMCEFLCPIARENWTKKANTKCRR